MKRILLILPIIILLASCTNTKDDSLSIDVDVLLNKMDMVESESNPGTFVFTFIEHEQITDIFDIVEVEKLTTEFAEFPYESIIIDSNISGYEDIIQELFDELASDDTLGGEFSHRLGPKAKLIITLESETATIKCEFYQDENEEIIMLIIEYIGIDGKIQSKEYNEEYSDIYSKLNDLLNE